METKHPSVNHIGLVRLGDSASHNSIFLSRQISQPANKQCFSLTPNQPAIQPASQPNKVVLLAVTGIQTYALNNRFFFLSSFMDLAPIAS